jgi:predicted nucleic acid-binding protein
MDLEYRANHCVEDETGILLSGLDAGERQVIELALTAGTGSIVLMGDYAGRESAKRLRLRVTGTVGLLLLAKERHSVSGVVELLHRIRQNGYWLSDETIEIARRLARE